MKVMRNQATLKEISKKDDCYVNASAQERISFIWELTDELWAMKGADYVERRLQRNVTNLIKNKKATGREKDKLDANYLQERNDV